MLVIHRVAAGLPYWKNVHTLIQRFQYLTREENMPNAFLIDQVNYTAPLE